MEKIKKSFSKIVVSRYFTFGVTTFLFVLLYVIAAVNYKGFSKPQVFMNLLIDNAALIIATAGTTFVLITGGIDISVGSVLSLSCMLIAWMLEFTNIPPVVIILIVLAVGILFGFVQGYLITKFNLQPFIITLAGQFFARGLTAIISRDTIAITNPMFKGIAGVRITVMGAAYISIGVIIALVVLVAATIVTEKTQFGRRLFAVGGSEQSSFLMGIDTNKVKTSAYMISGGLAALGGVVYTFIVLSGYPLHAVGLDMEAITASVIGGTLMSGGVAFMPGTLVGVLIQGLIQTIITFQGTLSAWWTRIVLAGLLCVFIVMQSLIIKQRNRINVE